MSNIFDSTTDEVLWELKQMVEELQEQVRYLTELIEEKNQ